MKYLICNLKEQKTLLDIVAYKETLQHVYNRNVDLIICPSYPYIPILHADHYKIGAQDVSKYSLGNHTGEVSASSLRSLDVKYCIVGHSERIKTHEETESDILQKMHRCFEEKIKVIYPIGETEEEYQNHQIYDILKIKLDVLIEHFNEKDLEQLIIAYEPIWLIHKEVKLNVIEIQDIINFIKTYLRKQKNVNVKVIYGGGITEYNFKLLQNILNLDGYLIGNFAQNPKNIVKLMSL